MLRVHPGPSTSVSSRFRRFTAPSTLLPPSTPPARQNSCPSPRSRTGHPPSRPPLPLLPRPPPSPPLVFRVHKVPQPRPPSPCLSPGRSSSQAGFRRKLLFRSRRRGVLQQQRRAPALKVGRTSPFPYRGELVETASSSTSRPEAQGRIQSSSGETSTLKGTYMSPCGISTVVRRDLPAGRSSSQLSGPGSIVDLVTPAVLLNDPEGRHGLVCTFIAPKSCKVSF